MTASDAAARSGCLWVARPDLGTLVVTGSERLSWLQGIVTSDVERLSNGEGSWGLVLTKQGKILADVAIVAAAEAAYLGIVRSAIERVAEWLSQFLVMEDAEIAERSDDFGWAVLHGPRAFGVAEELARSAGSPGGAAAIDFTGLGGAALVVPRDAFAKVEAEAMGRSGVHAASEAEWQRLRVERLLPLYGIDIDDKRSPHEASLDRRAVSWSKGCYLGQEAVCMQDMRGKVKRRLATVRLAPGDPPASGTPVTLPDGSLVGETRSAAESEVWGAPVAIALLSAAAAVPGTHIVVRGAPATVVEPR